METMTVAKFLQYQIALSGKTQRQIAAECDYPNANVITMFKKGITKLPLNKVTSMARALGVDPRGLLRLTMSEYHGEAWQSIEEIIGASGAATREELAVLALMRDVGWGRTPRLDVSENAAELSAAIRRAVCRDEAHDAAAVARVNRRRSRHE